MSETIEEGARCVACEVGHLRFVPNGECCCHVSPPCGACVDAFLQCDKCGDVIDQDEPLGEDKPAS